MHEILPKTRRLIKHGLSVMLMGLLCGFGLAFAINGAVEITPIPISFDYTMDAEPRAWRSAHVGAITNGLMAMLIAAVLPFLGIREKVAGKIVTGIVLVIWSNTIFYVASLWAPNRGLSLWGTAAGEGNLAGIIAYVPAVIAAVLLVYIVIYLIFAIPNRDEL